MDHHSKWMQLGCCVLALAASAAAQTVTGSGTIYTSPPANTVPMFTASSTIGNSPITVSGSSVGIGTPSAWGGLLDISNSSQGTGFRIDTNGSDGIGLYSFYGQQMHASSGLNYVAGWDMSLSEKVLQGATNTGFVYGLYPSVLRNFLTTGDKGTLSQLSGVTIQYGHYNSDSTASPTTTQAIGLMIQPYYKSGTITKAYDIYLGADNTGGLLTNQPYGIYQANTHWNYFAGNVGIGTANPVSLLSVGASSQFQVNSSGAVTSGSIVSSGPVGIGVSPQYTLDVAGQIHASQAIYASGGVTFSDGSSLTSANTLCGGDYAESVDVSGNRAKYEPGDLLVLDTDNPGKFLKSTEPYSTAVAGIYSTKPGALGRRQTTPRSPDEVPMAMVGIVPVKVTAENGPIKVGDLLVSSSVPGRAMKGTDRSQMLGAVIGKSMGSLDSGTGVIEMLVTLQ